MGRIATEPPPEDFSRAGVCAAAIYRAARQRKKVRGGDNAADADAGGVRARRQRNQYRRRRRGRSVGFRPRGAVDTSRRHHRPACSVKVHSRSRGKKNSGRTEPHGRKNENRIIRKISTNRARFSGLSKTSSPGEYPPPFSQGPRTVRLCRTLSVSPRTEKSHRVPVSQTARFSAAVAVASRSRPRFEFLIFKNFFPPSKIPAFPCRQSVASAKARCIRRHT